MTKKKSSGKSSRRTPMTVPAGEPSPGSGSAPEEKLDELRGKAEQKPARREEQPDEPSSREVADLVHELDTHRIKLEMQNEELRRLQLQLEESRSRYADLFDFAPVGYFIFDHSGIIRTVNLTGASMLGIPRTALLGTRFSLHVHEQDREIFHCHLEQLFKENGGRTCELRIVSPKDAVRHIRLESVPVINGQDGGTEIRTALSDISARKQAEQTLRQERNLLETIMDTTETMLVYLDRDFNFLRVNAAYARSCNLRPEEMIGKNHFALYPHPENEAIFRQVRDTGEPVFYRDKPFEFPDQPERGITYWDWSLHPVKDRDGRVSGLVFSLRETTDRKSAENILRRKQGQLQTIFDNLDEGLVIFDVNGNQSQVNSAALTLSGFASREEFLEKCTGIRDIFELSTAEEGVLDPDNWPHSRIIRGETLHNWEIKVRRRDKKWQRVFTYSGKLMRDGDEQPPQVLMTFSDITERKQAEEKIRLRNRVLQGIKDIFEAGLASASDRELAEKTLKIAEQITGSKFGFIGEIGPDGLLHEIAISNDVLAQCTIQGKGHRDPLENIPIVGLFGKVLNDGASMYTNEPAGHPDAVGVPAGHLLLSAFLGVPLKHKDRTIGIIALGSKPDGYGEEERQSVEILAPAFLETMYKNRAKRELQRSEARQRRQAEELNQLLQLTPIPMWIAHDEHCRVVSGNLAATSLLGVGPGDNVSQTPGSGQSPEVRHFRNGRRLSPEELPLQYAVAHKMPVRDVELDMVLPDGQIRHMLGGAVPLLDEAGRVHGGIAVYMDITVRKQMEARIQRAKMEWEWTFDSVPDLIAILDSNFRFKRVNKAMADRLGRKPHQCVNRTCHELIDHTSQPPPWCPVFKTLQDGGPHIAEREYPILNGTFLVSSTPLIDEKAELTGTVLVARDITEVKKAENLLKEGESRLKRAQQVASLGSWEFDQAGSLLTWSDELYRILGLQPQECSPSYRFFLRLVHPEDRRKVMDSYSESLRRGWKVLELEHRIVQKATGDIRYVHNKSEYFRDSDGRLLRSVGMLHDITERRQAELRIRELNRDLQHYVRKLAVANQELERSNQDLQQFAYIASHDLQEPLRTVSSFVQLLSRRYKGKLDEKADTYINFAVEGTGYMHNLLQGLLTFSRAGGGELIIRPVNLQQVVEKLTRTLQLKLEESGGKIECNELPVVEADETQIFQVMQNLVANALKFRGQKPPLVRIWSEYQDQEWVICIRDNGIGIDPQHADRIFLIFQRLHRKEEYEGTGIGLAVCKRIIERHGGRIWVESSPGRGSLFCFTLPEKKEEDR